jgi:molecular chaperone GrpE
MADDGAEVPNEETRPVPPESGPPTPPPGEDWETRFKYLLADFENFRRRSERDREGQTRQARGAVLRDLLPLLESFRSAGAAIAKLAPSDPLRQGMDLLDREWAKFLKHQGVEPVAEVGKPFRSEEAEAVGETPVRDGCPDGSVAEIVQQGYRFFGGLLRPAKVIVARASRDASPEAKAPTLPEAPDGGDS